MDESHVRLLLHTEVRWLSKGNCLNRFVELYDTLAEFMKDNEEMKVLSGNAARVQVCYLADIFGKLNCLNTELQGKNKTLIDAKTKIFGFVAKLRQYAREFGSFARLITCDVSDYVLMIITDHIEQMVDDFTELFTDLATMEFPDWLTQYSMIDLNEVEPALRDEMAELQNDASTAAVHRAKRQFMWLDEEMNEKYPNLFKKAVDIILPFPSSYLVECAFSAVTDILSRKRGSLDIIDRGDLRLKLTQLIPNIQALTREHQAQGFH